MKNLDVDTGKLVEEIETLSREKPEYSDLLALQRDILLCQREIKGKIQTGDIRPNRTELAQCVSDGVVFLKRIKVSPDLEAAVRLFKMLMSAMRKHSGEIDTQIALIEQSWASGNLDVRKMLSAAFEGESTQKIKEEGESAGVDVELLSLLLYNSIKPNLERCSEVLLPYADLAMWLRPECPVCGHSPSLSELQGEEGKRILLCSMCTTGWRYPRVKCAFCGNEEQESLRILFPAGGSGAFRADVCEKCKRYLKTVDSRKMDKKISPDLYDCLTIDMDLLAQREGYTRGA